MLDLLTSSIKKIISDIENIDYYTNERYLKDVKLYRNIISSYERKISNVVISNAGSVVARRNIIGEKLRLNKNIPICIEYIDEVTLLDIPRTKYLFNNFKISDGNNGRKFKDGYTLLNNLHMKRMGNYKLLTKMYTSPKQFKDMYRCFIITNKDMVIAPYNNSKFTSFLDKGFNEVYILKNEISTVKELDKIVSIDNIYKELSNIKMLTNHIHGTLEAINVTNPGLNPSDIKQSGLNQYRYRQNFLDYTMAIYLDMLSSLYEVILKKNNARIKYLDETISNIK